MSTAKNCPRDAQVMAAILKDMGISEYEPRVINLMLEFTYRECCKNLPLFPSNMLQSTAT